MLKLFLWLKYLRRRRIVFLSIAAVALSVSLLIVVASLFSGFIEAFERSAVEMLGDVVISPPPGAVFEKYPQFVARLEATDFVEAASGTLASEGLLHVGRGNVRPVGIWGIEPERRARVNGFKDALLRQKELPGAPSFDVPGKPDRTGGVVGIGVVAQADPETDEYDQDAVLEAMLGERVVITTGTVDLSNSEQLPKRKMLPFYVADVAFSGVHDIDSGFVYVPIEVLQKTLHPQKDMPATTMSAKLKPGVDPELAVAQITGLWRVFATEELGWSKHKAQLTSVDTARQLQYRSIREFRKQMWVLLLIFGVISFSVVVLVFCIFYMIVRLKRCDIAIIKSCGAAGLSVVWIFLGFGATVGAIGAGIGVTLGYVITKNIAMIENQISVIFGLKLWSSSVYMFNKIPNQVDWGWAFTFAGLAVAAAALGALVPAIVAALTRPVDVLRYD